MSYLRGKEHCVLRFFQLYNGKTYEDMGFVNIAKTASAAQDEEVWVELQSYRDRNHLDEILVR